MSDFDRLDFKSDDVLRASDLNLILEAIRRSMGRVEVGDGLFSEADPRGGLRISGTPARGQYLAAASGIITGRSAAIPGAGNATVWQYRGTSIADGGTVPVFNYAQALADGQPCIIEQDTGGAWWAWAPSQPGYCQLPSSLGPATGTWPSLSITTLGGVTVYVPVGSVLASIGTQTIRNYRNVTWAASKTTVVEPRLDGAWEIRDQDC